MPIYVNYDRNAVVAYAAKWAHDRNPQYMDFDKFGGDCTNFASQCIYAGSSIMNYTPVYGWYYINSYNRSPSWTGVEYLYNFLINNKREGPFAKVTHVNKIMIGDIIQLGTEDRFYHSLVVTYTGNIPSRQNILVSTHTYDSYMRPLSSYSINKIRYLHIEGVRK